MRRAESGSTADNRVKIRRSFEHRIPLMLSPSQLRWLTVCVLYMASALNYLDRNVLSALAPTLLKEFGINNEQFGYVISAFSIVYAFSAPLLGPFFDRFGLSAVPC